MTNIALADGTSVPIGCALRAAELLGEMRPARARLALMDQFKVSESTAKRYASGGGLLLQEQMKTMMPTMAAAIVERMWSLVDKAESENRINAALKGLAAIAKLTGVAQPSRVTITIDDPVKLPELSTEELAILAKFDVGSDATH